MLLTTIKFKSGSEISDPLQKLVLAHSFVAYVTERSAAPDAYRLEDVESVSVIDDGFAPIYIMLEEESAIVRADILHYKDGKIRLFDKNNDLGIPVDGLEYNRVIISTFPEDDKAWENFPTMSLGQYIDRL